MADAQCEPAAVRRVLDQPVEGIHYGGLPSFLRAAAGQKDRRQYVMQLYDSLRKATRARAQESRKEFVPFVFYDLTQFEYFREFFNETLAAFRAAIDARADGGSIWSEIVAKASRSPGGCAVRPVRCRPRSAAGRWS